MACYKLAFVARRYIYKLVDKAQFKGMDEGLQINYVQLIPAFPIDLMKYISSYFH